MFIHSECDTMWGWSQECVCVFLNGATLSRFTWSWNPRCVCVFGGSIAPNNRRIKSVVAYECMPNTQTEHNRFALYIMECVHARLVCMPTDYRKRIEHTHQITLLCVLYIVLLLCITYREHVGRFSLTLHRHARNAQCRAATQILISDDVAQKRWRWLWNCRHERRLLSFIVDGTVVVVVAKLVSPERDGNIKTSSN